MTDVALDPYTSHGHDGIIKNKKILNDETIQILSKQALLQSQMGCDVIAPSDMMDGRIGVIRKVLDKNNFKDVNYYLIPQNMHRVFMVHLEMQLDQVKQIKSIRKPIKWTIEILMKLFVR